MLSIWLLVAVTSGQELPSGPKPRAAYRLTECLPPLGIRYWGAYRTRRAVVRSRKLSVVLGGEVTPPIDSLLLDACGELDFDIQLLLFLQEQLTEFQHRMSQGDCGVCRAKAFPTYARLARHVRRLERAANDVHVSLDGHDAVWRLEQTRDAFRAVCQNACGNSQQQHQQSRALHRTLTPAQPRQ